MRGGSPVGLLGVTSGFRNLLAPAPSGARELPPAEPLEPLSGSCQEAGASPRLVSVGARRQRWQPGSSRSCAQTVPSSPGAAWYPLPWALAPWQHQPRSSLAAKLVPEVERAVTKSPVIMKAALALRTLGHGLNAPACDQMYLPRALPVWVSIVHGSSWGIWIFEWKCFLLSKSCFNMRCPSVGVLLQGSEKNQQNPTTKTLHTATPAFNVQLSYSQVPWSGCILRNFYKISCRCQAQDGEKR